MDRQTETSASSPASDMTSLKRKRAEEDDEPMAPAEKSARLYQLDTVAVAVVADAAADEASHPSMEPASEKATEPVTGSAIIPSPSPPLTTTRVTIISSDALQTLRTEVIELKSYSSALDAELDKLIQVEEDLGWKVYHEEQKVASLTERCNDQVKQLHDWSKAYGTMSANCDVLTGRGRGLDYDKNRLNERVKELEATNDNLVNQVVDLSWDLEEEKRKRMLVEEQLACEKERNVYPPL